MTISRSIWTIALLTLLVALVFAFDLTPWVRGGYGWRWEYVPLPLVRILPLIVGLIVYVTGGYLLLTRTRRTRYTLLWALIGTVGLSFAVGYAREGDLFYFLFTRTASIASSAEWWAGATIDWQNGQWRDWLSVMDALGQRTSNAATSPPGMPMLYALATDIFNRTPILTDALYRQLLPYQCHNYELLAFTPAQWASAWFGMLTPLWAGLSVLPIYAITRRLAPESDARIPVIWWALVPGILAFATSSSTLFPLIALAVFYPLLRGLSPFHPGFIALAGVLYGTGLFLNFIFLPLAALYGFYTLLHYWLTDRPKGVHWTRPFVVGGWFGIGALAPWLIFYALTGQTFIEILIQSLNTHLDLERPYGYWVWMHVWDWAVWTGFALVVVAAWGIGRSARMSLRQVPMRDLPTLALALILTVLAFTLSGTTRGESGRIWLALSPFALIATSMMFRDSSCRAWLLITGTQAFFTLVLAATLAAYNAPDLSSPPQPVMVSVSRPTDATFTTTNGAIYQLTGWDAAVEDGVIDLKLAWQGVDRPIEPQWFSAILVSPDGATYPIEAWQPHSGDSPFPTPCWSPGMTIGDTVRLPLPEAAVPGDWYISLAAFGGGAGEDGRLAVRLPDGTIDTQVGLGPILVP